MFNSIILKKCLLCHDYNRFVHSTNSQEEQVRFFRLRDEASLEVSSRLKKYISKMLDIIEDFKISQSDIEFDEMPLISEKQKLNAEHNIKITKYAESLCVNCDYGTPKVFEFLRNKKNKSVSFFS